MSQNIVCRFKNGKYFINIYKHLFFKQKRITFIRLNTI